MGSAQVQGKLWGPGARDWAELNEPGCTPFYEAVFDAIAVGPGMVMLDAGCGGGFALQLAAKRGATVTGFDACAPLLDIARERVPAADIRQGDLESLPFAGGTFDAVLRAGPAGHRARGRAIHPRGAGQGVRRQPPARRQLPPGQFLPVPDRPGVTPSATRVTGRRPRSPPRPVGGTNPARGVGCAGRHGLRALSGMTSSPSTRWVLPACRSRRFPSARRCAGVRPVRGAHVRSWTGHHARVR